MLRKLTSYPEQQVAAVRKPPRRAALLLFVFSSYLSLTMEQAIGAVMLTIDNEDDNSTYYTTTLSPVESTTDLIPSIDFEPNLILDLFLPALTSPAPSELDSLDDETRQNCRVNQADKHCYLYVRNLNLSMPQAERYCNARNMSLTHVTLVNAAFLRQLVDDSEQYNSTTKCRTVMVANIPQHLEAIEYVKYGTYAYIASSACAVPKFTNEQHFESPQRFMQHYRMCGKQFDCTRVDWLAPNPFVCVTHTGVERKNELEHAVPSFGVDTSLAKETLRADAWCMKSVLVENGYEYLVTCEPVGPSPPIFLYPPMCVPLWQFDFQHQALIERIVNATTNFLLAKSETQPYIEFLSIIHFYQDKLDRLCAPPTMCVDTLNNDYVNKNSSARVQAQTFGLCRRELRFNPALSYAADTTAKFAQIWPHGVVPVVIGDEFPGEVQRFILKAMQYINHASGACVQFRLRNATDKPNEFVLISQASDNDCSSSYVGRSGYGIQTVYLGRHCTAQEANFLRPLLNVLGLPNESSRSDRDGFVRAYTERLHRYDADELAKIDLPGGGLTEQQTEYDLQSAVQLPARFGFSTDQDVLDFLTSEVVVESNSKPNASVKLSEPGRAVVLSQNDKKKLQFLYGSCSRNNMQ